jgi:hypothetical protein
MLFGSHFLHVSAQRGSILLGVHIRSQQLNLLSLLLDLVAKIHVF